MTTKQRQAMDWDMTERIAIAIADNLISVQAQLHEAHQQGDMLACIYLRDRMRRLATMLMPAE